MDDQVGFRDFDILLKVEEGELKLGEFLLGYRDTCTKGENLGQTKLLRKGLTHFAVAILDSTAGHGKGFEIWLHGAADESM